MHVHVGIKNKSGTNGRDGSFSVEAMTLPILRMQVEGRSKVERSKVEAERSRTKVSQRRPKEKANKEKGRIEWKAQSMGPRRKQTKKRWPRQGEAKGGQEKASKEKGQLQLNANVKYLIGAIIF